jgi:hypothetical protein
MVHLRVIAPPALAEAAYRVVRDHPSAIDVVRLRGAAVRPDGDLILCDVAREDASLLVAELRSLGLERDGSIVIEPVSSLVSDAARRAERAAVGSPADAVVWETVEFQTSESAALSFSFVVFMVLATMIAALGILQDSQILITGAMVVGPEFGPLAGLCVALAYGPPRSQDIRSIRSPTRGNEPSEKRAPRSSTATSTPACASRQAATAPPNPLPTTIASYASLLRPSTGSIRRST